MKTPLQYLLCLVFLGGVLGLQYGGGVLLDRLFPDGMSAGSFGALFGWLGSLVLLSFLSLYLLVVSVHLLGLLFVTRKEALGWLQAR